MSTNPASVSTEPHQPSSAVQGSALLALASAVVVVVSLFMEWGTDKLFGDSLTARKVPLQLLWDTTPASLDDFPVMWPALLGAVLMVVGVLVAKAKAMALVGSVLALVIALLYVNGVRAVLDDSLYSIDASLTDAVGIGAWVCVLAAVGGIVGAIGQLRSRRS